MRNQNIFKSFFFSVTLIFVFIIPSYVFAQCNQPDAPDCTCFNLRGPGGVWIHSGHRDSDSRHI